MFKRLTTAALFGFVLSACAGGPPPEPPGPPPLDPVGTYDFTVAAEGMEIIGTMIIQGSEEEGYTGSMDTDMGGAAVTDIVVDGQIMTFFIPEADASARIEFDGDTFTGGMDGAMGAADMFGTKRKGS